MLDLHRRVEKILMGSSPNHHHHNQQQQQQHQPQQNPRYFQQQISVPELNCIGETSQYPETDSEDKRQQQQQQQQLRNGQHQLRLNSSRSSSSSLLSSPQQNHETLPTSPYFSFSSHPPPYTERKNLVLPHLTSGQDSLPSYYQNQKVLPAAQSSSESLSELRTSGFGSGSKLSTISESSASQQQKNVGLDLEYLLNQTTGPGSGVRTGHMVKK
jgi:hypothetical protein